MLKSADAHMRPFSQHLRPQNRVFASEWVTGAHLINAIEQENITIENADGVTVDNFRAM